MNLREIYVICSPGRTGSHIILEALSGTITESGGLGNAVCYWHNKNFLLNENTIPCDLYNQDNNVVIHTHNLGETLKDLKLDIKNITLILSYRRDIFEQTMSVLVAQITTEWSGKDYSNKPAVPIVVSSDNFKKIFLTFQQWPGIIPQLDEYKKVVSIYYEDLLDNAAEHIASKLDINYDVNKVGKIQRKSPYLYKNWILNWEELAKEFN
jgi:LPS sulfotransferase NodH